MGEEKKCPCDLVIEMKEEIKQHEKRLADGDKRFDIMQFQLNCIADDIKEIKADLKELKEKPGRKWDNIVSNITNWAAILLLAYVAAQIGLQ